MTVVVAVQRGDVQETHSSDGDVSGQQRSQLSERRESVRQVKSKTIVGSGQGFLDSQITPPSVAEARGRLSSRCRGD